MFTLIVIYSFYEGLLFSAINEYFGDKTLNNYINIDGHSSQWFIMIIATIIIYCLLAVVYVLSLYDNKKEVKDIKSKEKKYNKAVFDSELYSSRLFNTILMSSTAVPMAGLLKWDSFRLNYGILTELEQYKLYLQKKASHTEYIKNQLNTYKKQLLNKPANKKQLTLHIPFAMGGILLLLTLAAFIASIYDKTELIWTIVKIGYFLIYMIGLLPFILYPVTDITEKERKKNTKIISIFLAAISVCVAVILYMLDVMDYSGSIKSSIAIALYVVSSIIILLPVGAYTIGPMMRTYSALSLPEGKALIFCIFCIFGIVFLALGLYPIVVFLLLLLLFVNKIWKRLPYYTGMYLMIGLFIIAFSSVITGVFISPTYTWVTFSILFAILFAILLRSIFPFVNEEEREDIELLQKVKGFHRETKDSIRETKDSIRESIRALFDYMSGVKHNYDYHFGSKTR
jgi:hypothetical protein